MKIMHHASASMRRWHALVSNGCFANDTIILMRMALSIWTKLQRDGCVHSQGHGRSYPSLVGSTIKPVHSLCGDRGSSCSSVHNNESLFATSHFVLPPSHQSVLVAPLVRTLSTCSHGSFTDFPTTMDGQLVSTPANIGGVFAHCHQHTSHQRPTMSVASLGFSA